MTKEILVNQKYIENRIYTIRGFQVMLDTHLADIYGVKPFRLREQVKRNQVRFPTDFMFQLTESEAKFMVSQNAIPSLQHLGGHLPYVFTEQGVAMLSAVLRSEEAVKVSIEIMKAFVIMRRMILDNAALFSRLDKIEFKQNEFDQKFEQLFKALDEKKLKPDSGVFYDGQVFDAYIFVADLIKKAKNSIILIDNYIDESVLMLFTKRKLGVEVEIFTKHISNSLKLDVERFNQQYPPVSIEIFTAAHDRFLLIDNTELYHIGASLKDLGKKWFAFSKMNAEIDKMLSFLRRHL